MLSIGVHDRLRVFARARARRGVRGGECVCVCVTVCSGGVGMLNKYYAKSMWTKAADVSQ